MYKQSRSSFKSDSKLLSLCCWNVHGLSTNYINKLSNSDFLRFIVEHDLLVLTENGRTTYLQYPDLNYLPLLPGNTVQKSMVDSQLELL